jgi:aminoglycoside/choline kinase family phosphotransferase
VFNVDRRLRSRHGGRQVDSRLWADLGTPARYIAAHARFRERYGGKGSSAGFAGISEHAKVSPRAKVHNSVIWAGATVGPSADLHSAIVAENVHINTRARGPVVRADAVPGNCPLRIAAQRLGWDSPGTIAMPLDDRGSARTFTRLCRGASRAILIVHTDERPENFRYAGHASFLRKRGVPVPRVLLDLPEQRLCAVEDMGDETLGTRAASLRRGKSLRRMYIHVLDALLKLHSIPTHGLEKHPGLEKRFSGEIYEWERRLMADHFLRGALHLDEKTVGGAMRDLRTVSSRLERIRPVLVHRDMQSTNVLFRGKRLALIDFQGMRLGPAVYDLASLLCDPYVMLASADQAVLLSYYLERCGGCRRVNDLFWTAAVQRLAQALGAFGRLSTARGTGRFSRYFLPGLRMMNRALDHLDGLQHLKCLVDRLLHKPPPPLVTG